jgi:DNA mismatch repair protein MutS
MQQYWDLKNSEKCKGALLFFRMGDFYELFGSDAEEAHALLGITLTSREKSADAPKMAGVPHHSAESYLERLLNAGRKVAIAEQMEAPDTKEGKGPVRREIVRVLTPGIRLGLEAGEGIYTARFAMNRAFAAIDSGTGDAVIDAELDPREVLGVVTQLNVKHLLIDSLDLIPTEALALLRDLKILVEVMPSMEFNPKLDTLVAELVKYLLQNQSVPSAAHLKPARSLKGDRVLRLSPAALQHLDVIPGFSPLNVFDSL